MEQYLRSMISLQQQLVVQTQETSKLLQFLKNTFRLIFYHKYLSDFILLLTQNITHCVL